MDEYGWIYIINNKERDGDGVFKVGYTSDLKSRLSKLNSETGSYGKFEQIAKFFVTDMEAAERECHEELEDYRKQDNREFFQGNQKEIINIVKNIISNYKPVDELPEYDAEHDEEDDDEDEHDEEDERDEFDFSNPEEDRTEYEKRLEQEKKDNEMREKVKLQEGEYSRFSRGMIILMILLAVGLMILILQDR